MNQEQCSLSWDSQIAAIFNDDAFSDVKFVIGQENTEFCGHKLLLALRSSVFAEAFYGGTTAETNTLSIPDVQPKAFHKMLEYVYTDTIHFNNLEEAYATSIVAKKYAMLSLQRKCQEYVNGQIVFPEIACKIFEIARSPQLQFKAVENSCRQAFIHQTKSVLQSRAFLKADITTVTAILENDTLAIDCEFDILQAVLKWGSAQCCRNNQSVVEANIRHFIQPLLKYVRFLTIPLQNLRGFFETSNILNAVEVCSLISAKLQPNVNLQLPEVLCPLTQNRLLPTKSTNENDQEFEKFYDCNDTMNDSQICEKISDKQVLPSEDTGVQKSSDTMYIDATNYPKDMQSSCNLISGRNR